MMQREGHVRFWRIFKIDQMLREESFPSVKGLANLFEVSERTIERDIEFLRDRYNAPIEYNFEKKGYHYVDTTFFLKTLFLTGEELFSIAVIEKTLQQYRNTPLESQMRKIFEKIRVVLPHDLVSFDSMWVDNSITFIADPTPEINQNNFTKVFEGLKRRVSISFFYRSLDQNEPEQRVVNPYHILCQRGAWYLIAFCHVKNELRIFAFSRMGEVSLVEKMSFTIPSDFLPEAYIDPNIGVWLTTKESFTVRLLFSPEIGVFAEERVWSADQEVKVHPDKSVEVVFSTTQFEELKRFVLGQGSTVKVLEPAELVEAVRKEIEKISSAY